MATGDPICRHGIYLNLCKMCLTNNFPIGNYGDYTHYGDMEDRFKPLTYGDSRKTCPCQFEGVLACKHSCSCKWPVMSGGCERCCRYGSEAQQLGAAKAIVERERKLRQYESIVNEATDLANDIVTKLHMKKRRPRRKRRGEQE